MLVIISQVVSELLECREKFQVLFGSIPNCECMTLWYLQYDLFKLHCILVCQQRGAYAETIIITCAALLMQNFEQLSESNVSKKKALFQESLVLQQNIITQTSYFCQDLNPFPKNTINNFASSINSPPFLTSYENFLFIATNPEPRHCPYVGKFDIKNLVWTQRNAHALMKHIRQLDSRYFDQNYYSNKYSRSLYGERSRMMRRTKRLNQDIDCDNESFSSLVIGCISRDRMEFISKCSLPDLITCKQIGIRLIYRPSMRYTCTPILMQQRYTFLCTLYNISQKSRFIIFMILK